MHDDIERRQVRSHHPSVALQLQLAALVERFGLQHAVVGDRGGHLWAAAPLDARAETLAQLASGRASLGLRQDDLEEVLLLRAVQVGAAELVLTLQAGESAVRRGDLDRALQHGVSAVARILTPLLS